jgi:hypothetical protein
LIWAPIIHTQADLGSMIGSVRSIYARKVGLEKWDEHVAMVEELWSKTDEAVRRLDLDYRYVRIYQDGLPNCGQELRIVKDMIAAGSRNHRLLLDLVEKGAALAGTESPKLLIEEYELVRGAIKSIDAGGEGKLSGRQEARLREILKERDRYIARRIDETLGAGETGLIFLGMLHDLKGLLPRNIRLTVLGQNANGARKAP